ncbi:hypothetical protein CY34DRAFT_801897 [Suillus luteus UH-Slu-Lm8-n1]|uniref:Uncharacterized protein n=1 Tax=Suillus luteus UH-Slu-Lm8-n1 TaxID=930992 RepID=A0A0D0A4Y8_9AGAM|nr:hypothetical protein CY34DRAFT_801897 [Suillus luteus UH-Slu-Lm8-n1]
MSSSTEPNQPDNRLDSFVLARVRAGALFMKHTLKSAAQSRKSAICRRPSRQMNAEDLRFERLCDARQIQ